jgi:hypothetical protein
VAAPPETLEALFVMNANGTDQKQRSFPGDGWNNLANWGQLRLMGRTAAR